MTEPMASPSLTPASTRSSSGVRLVAADGRELPLRTAALTGDARGGLARIRLTQTFHNPHPEPLTVAYSLPLPLEAAVSGFSFVVGEQTVVGEVNRRASARQRFEEALVEGRSASLLEEDRSTLFRQEVGNIPPETTVEIRIDLDQRLLWRDGGWEWRFPTVVAPRYLGAPGRVPDAERVTQEVADRPGSPRLELDLSIRDVLAEPAPSSPTHEVAIRSTETGAGVRFAAETRVALDRDVVVHWPVATSEVEASLDLSRPNEAHPRVGEAHGLLTLVPPIAIEERAAVPRDLIVLLDTSGSMSGVPLRQAKEVVAAVIGSLGDADRLEMISFSTAPRRWERTPRQASADTRRAALEWLDALTAGGGTEMRSGLREALHSLRDDAQRQILLVTDGLIGFESEMVAEILEGLPRGCRLHTLGVGSAVNRSLTGAAARAGRGTETVIGLGEAVAPVVPRVVAAMQLPVVVDLTLGGSALVEHAPRALPDLHAGRPFLVALKLRPAGGTLTVHGRTAAGDWSRTLDVAPLPAGAGSGAVSTLWAREAVEDLEMQVAGVAARRSDRRQELERAIERTGLDFQIATRLTTWIAVSEKATVDPGAPLRRQVVPQQLPWGLSAEGLGLREAAMPLRAGAFASRSAARFKLQERAGLRQQRAVFSRSELIDLAHADDLGDVDDFDAPADSAAPGRLYESALPSAPSEPSTPLTARIVVQNERTFAVEITLEETLEWHAGDEVEVRLADGEWVTVRVVKKRTTRDGRYVAGRILRLVLDPIEGEVVQLRLADRTSIEILRA